MPGNRPRTGIDKNCTICGKQYYVSGWRLKRGSSNFCSTECQNHKQYERAKFTCFFCKKKFDDSPSRRNRRKFCSLECHNKFQSEKEICQKERRRTRIKKARENGTAGKSGGAVRKLALEFKEHKCQICEYDEFKCCLDVHHIDRNPNNNDINNLAVLCVMCHRKVHRKIIEI